jgi:hypothetical protein
LTTTAKNADSASRRKLAPIHGRPIGSVSLTGGERPISAARRRDGDHGQRQQGGVAGEQRLKQVHYRAAFAESPPRRALGRQRTTESGIIEARTESRSC